VGNPVGYPIVFARANPAHASESAGISGLARWLRRAALVLVLALPASSGGVVVALAANTGCVVGGTTADCPTVPTDGIDYDSPAVDTVNITTGTTGVVVAPGVIGIDLRELGADGPDSSNSNSFPDFGSATTTVDHDGDGGTAAWTVLADGNGDPVVLTGGYYIHVIGDGTYQIAKNGSTLETLANATDLAEYLQGSANQVGGSAAGSLTVNNPGTGGTAASFTTSGAEGIHVESRGGNGGNGGCTTILLATWCDDGDTGGNAGSVAVNNDGSITTTGGIGISATSIGGNGGDAGIVTVVNGGSITTNGAKAYGIFAQSIGAGAGTGSGGGGAVAIGGNGGGESSGNKVTVTNSGMIETFGTDSFGILAQSIGGGGGDGGSTGGIIAVGGNGGSGGGSDLVKVYNSGTVTTHEAGSVGIFAQSVGGGGGNGGNAYSGGLGGSVAVGGDGGLGGNGGKTIINELTGGQTLADLVAGTIVTNGDRAHGIQAQSVGGGGGNGGLAVSGAIGEGFSLSFALGGTGAKGGVADDVTVNERGHITTVGDLANGIFAQSVGGGGGSGGGAVAASAAAGGYSLNLAFGGDSGEGGAGAAVDVNVMGGIDTTGDMSHGILAQSVGGGGGNGGYAVAGGGLGAFSGNLGLGGDGDGGGAGGSVTVNVITDGADDTIHTRGEGSHAIFAQSVGGGGGSGGWSAAAGIGAGAVSVSLGGSGAGGGAGGTVTVTNSDKLITEKTNAYGLLAQSIGGGGGNGGFSFAGAAGVMAASVAIGGNGGAGGNGGDVTATNHGAVQTLGDLSYGILAQSIGGGGGNGGGSVAATLTISVEDVPAIGASVAIGGHGGDATLGGHVILNNDGSITTGTKTLLDAGDPDLVGDEEYARTGNGAHALFAQSIGGGGGNGGFAGAGALSLGTGASFSVAVGGYGGTGGNAGAVELYNTGAATTIRTWGDGADGIHAQSIGGGGGDGGFGLALAASIGGTTNISVGVAIGGKGGAGGTGNTVTVSNAGAIITDGDKSNGIFAQSVGGGGGTGGFAVSGTATVSETAGQIGVAVGGGGGTGNFSQKVKVDNSGSITTYGQESLGILAQSIGGSGGNGGLSLVGQFIVGTENSAQVGVSIGGGAGSGNYGGEVEVTNLALGDITTYGFGSHGIFAQSVGGGGGRGGLAAYGGLSLGGQEKALNLGVTVGGSGGTGGTGGLVTVNNDGDVRVFADNAMGVLAQSIGGGGGDGGNSVNAMFGITNVTADKSATYNVSVAVGGNAGSGNHGGVVNVTNSGTIVTGSITTIDDKTYVTGVGGTGIFAQSVGGGGGIGGRANNINLQVGPKCSLPVVCDGPKSQANNLALSATVGGKGGSGGDGSAVTVVNTGEIVTAGDTADGIFAQSIGGGGGTGGNGIVGTGEILPVPIELAFIPIGQTAIYKNISVTIGGDAGSSGKGGTVDVDNSKNITTFGSNSNGIFAQSVGGGGGVGGKAVIGATGTIGVGGKGGSSGNGDQVTVSNLDGAIIETFGVASNGIFAQSVGGGGGVGGNVDRALATGLDLPFGLGHLPINLGIGLALGQGGGNGGNGGIVDVDVTGQILTHGDNAAGVFAQSVGGGGGVLGELGNDLPVLDLLSWHIGSNGDAGNGGTVDVLVNGTIKTAGNSATGIFAQSSGGQGTGDKVTVTVNGTVQTAAILGAEDGTAGAQTRGMGSVGIMAQSSGWGGNGDVEINLDSLNGLVSGGRTVEVASEESPDDTKTFVGVGVWIIDGKDNTITNKGTITTAGGVDAGLAILASGSDPTNADNAKKQVGGNEAVSNFGTVTGAFDLGVGTNSFVNEVGGTLNAGLFATLGDGNLLTNNGWMSTGGKSRVMTTAVNGDVVQNVGATYGVDLDLEKTDAPGIDGETGEADMLDVDGKLTMAGVVDLTILNAGNALPGEHSVTIAQSIGDFDASAIGLTTPASVVAHYSLSTTEQALLLNYGINFDVDGLNDNQSAIGGYINDVQLAGGSEDLEPVIASLFGIPDLKTYKETLDQLSPEPYVINETLAVLASLTFENQLMSCKVQDSVNGEGQCAWASASGHKTERSENEENLGFDQTNWGLSTGAQGAVNENVFVGVGGAWDDISGQANGNAVSNGQRFQVGGVVKGIVDDSAFALAVVGGYSTTDVTRQVDMPNGPSYTLEGTQNIGLLAAHARASHTIEMDKFYVRPMVDVGVTQVSIDDYRETGGPVALEIEGSDHTYVTVAPALEFGGEMDLNDETVLRAFARVGALGIVAGDAPEISAGFTAAPDGVDPFTIHGDVDEAMYDVTVGFDVIADSGLVFRLAGDAKAGETTTSYGGSLKLSAPF